MRDLLSIRRMLHVLPSCALAFGLHAAERTPSSVNEVLEAAIANERDLASTLLSHRPVVEAYLQTVKPDPVMGVVPVRDNYFFGRLELASGRENGKPAKKKTINLLEDFHSAVFKPED